MTTTAPAAVLRSQSSLLQGTLLVLVALFVLINVIAILQMHRGETTNRLIIDNMLSSIEQVDQIARDIDKKRLLIDAHVFENSIQSMEGLEAAMAAIDDDYAATAKAYDAIVNLPGERESWKTLQAQVAALEQPIQKVLAFSRANLDSEARMAVVRLEAHFDAIAATAETLIKLNHEEANSVVHAAAARRQLSTLYLGGMMLAGVALALFAVHVTRLVRSRGEELAHLLLVLEERNRELDAFGGRVAHDLRGPLMTITLSASRLSERAPQEEGTATLLRRAVAQMDSLIEDLLTLARIDAQAPGVVSLTKVVAEAAQEDLRPPIEEAGGVLHVSLAPAELPCSEGLLREVLWNLGENAVKYRRADTQLELRIEGRVTDRGYELRVSDNGAGMTLREAHHAFEPLFRGEQARANHGTGLGLAIVRRVIEASGGSVSVSSRLGHGTTFVLKLPRASGC